jgi:integrase
MPLRVIYRRAVSHGEISINPTTGLELPAVRGRRDRIATPEQAAQLLNALRAGDRAVWAVALYAGLRRGELMALRWQDIDLDPEPDPGRALLGHQSRPDRTEKPGRHPHRPRRPTAP